MIHWHVRKNGFKLDFLFSVLQGTRWLGCQVSRREPSPSSACLGWQTVATVFVATFTDLLLTSMFLHQMVSNYYLVNVKLSLNTLYIVWMSYMHISLFRAVTFQNDFTLRGGKNHVILLHPTLCLPLSASFWKGFTSDNLGEFKRELNSAVLKDMRSNKDNVSITVLAVDITQKESEDKWLQNASKKMSLYDNRADPGFKERLLINKWTNMNQCYFNTQWKSVAFWHLRLLSFFLQACMVTMDNAVSVSCG